MKARYIVYGFFLLSLVGTWAYFTYLGAVPQPPVMSLNTTLTHAKVNSFNNDLQRAYSAAQTTRQNQQVNLILTDADATVLVNQKETALGNPIDEWVVHFRNDGTVQVWGTKSSINSVLHHKYLILFTYVPDSFDNRATAGVVGINFSGLVLPSRIVSSLSGINDQPTFEFPTGTVVTLKVSEGQMQVSVTILPVLV